MSAKSARLCALGPTEEWLATAAALLAKPHRASAHVPSIRRKDADKLLGFDHAKPRAPCLRHALIRAKREVQVLVGSHGDTEVQYRVPDLPPAVLHEQHDVVVPKHGCEGVVASALFPERTVPRRVRDEHGVPRKPGHARVLREVPDVFFAIERRVPVVLAHGLRSAYCTRRAPTAICSAKHGHGRLLRNTAPEEARNQAGSACGCPRCAGWF